jgi:hypothetical protein
MSPMVKRIAQIPTEKIAQRQSAEEKAFGAASMVRNAVRGMAILIRGRRR